MTKSLTRMIAPSACQTMVVVLLCPVLVTGSARAVADSQAGDQKTQPGSAQQADRKAKGVPTHPMTSPRGDIMFIPSYGLALSNADIVALTLGAGAGYAPYDTGGVAFTRMSAGVGGTTAAAGIGMCAFIQRGVCIAGGFLQARLLRTYGPSPWPNDWYTGLEIEALLALFKISVGIFYPGVAFSERMEPHNPRVLLRLTLGHN